MEDFFGAGRKNWFPISLGFTCHVKVLIDQICQKDKRAYPRLPFDWIGTPMSSVYELATSNFDGMNDPEKLLVRRRFTDKETEYLTHVDYNFVFVHDYKNIRSITPEQFTKIDTDYKRRIERWNYILRCGSPLIFMRLEQENNEKRIAYEGTARDVDEYTYLQRFSTFIKSCGAIFYIIYFSTTRPKGYDEEHKIITIHFNKQRPDMIVSGDHLAALLGAHRDFIQRYF